MRRLRGGETCRVHRSVNAARMSACATLLTAALALSAQAPAADPVLRAMHDEIERAKGLTIPNLEAPYFIQFVLDQEESFNVSATLGGLMERRHERFRSPDIRVRVGSYKFDNGNFAGGGGGGGTRYDVWSGFPSKTNIRFCATLFLAGDRLALTRGPWKPFRASGRPCGNLTQSEQLDDFAP